MIAGPFCYRSEFCGGVAYKVKNSHGIIYFMENVTFDDSQGAVTGASASQSVSSGMSDWLIKKGIVKNKYSADVALLLFALSMLAFATYFAVKSNLFVSSAVVQEPPPFEDARFDSNGNRIIE